VQGRIAAPGGNSVMKFITLIGATAGLILLCCAASSAAEAKKNPTTPRLTGSPAATSSQMNVLATRKMLIERMKASRERLKNSLSYYEEELEKQSADYETKKGLYAKDLIPGVEVENSERVLNNKRLEMERVRQWIAEDDVALSLAEEATQEKLARLSTLPLGGYEETATLIHYNGAASWSLASAQKIARFFRGKFGHSLPLSATGQSPTHDRMGLDHREALDVAVQPDSAEGRGLMAYLKKSGIPFIAFRGAVRSMSTGAHIHIGKPSPRIVEVKQRSPHPAIQDKSAQHG
jgi:hypothetical protein